MENDMKRRFRTLVVGVASLLGVAAQTLPSYAHWHYHCWGCGGFAAGAIAGAALARPYYYPPAYYPPAYPVCPVYVKPWYC
jgi:hypothetical protein